MKILLATDGSKHSHIASAQCGKLISNRQDIVVKILVVADYTADFEVEDFISETEFIELVEKNSQERAQSIISETEKILRYHNDDVRIEKTVHKGSAKKLIVEEAINWKADLVIVGSHGYGILKRTLLGSVSDAVVDHVPCSILVVRENE